ncbi:MAG: hypothetical protein QM770_10195 [Tepidisphaeraceae bacterium]
MILSPDTFRGYVDAFNAADNEDVGNLVPNAASFDWMTRNVPRFACPDEAIQRVYYYRWWTFRKHLKSTPAGTIVTEFILPVRHAGMYNSISCALGHHLAEARWLRDQTPIDEYLRFWFIADAGRPEPRFHRYSSWLAHAAWQRACVTGNFGALVAMIDLLVNDYAVWGQEKQLPDGAYFQFDVWDGMEESISGGRKARNVRPTINSYMQANAVALSKLAKLAGRPELVETFDRKADELTKIVHRLWDERAEFFKVQFEDGSLSDAHEAIGFIPWVFNIPQRGLEGAWKQLIDPEGFWAPRGLTTAERRHPKFRSHGVGHCEWDGAAWPFATSQTLDALANVLRHYDQPHVTREHYLEAMRIYAACHTMNGRDYIGEYHDEVTGAWLKGDNPRSRYYNHSTYADLVIAGLVGLVPREDESIEVDPLVPAGAWDWFCLDDVPYRGRSVSIVWDRTGDRFQRGAGLSIFVNDNRIGHRPDLGRLVALLT